MGHTPRCANAKGPRSSCQCACGGHYHGDVGSLTGTTSRRPRRRRAVRASRSRDDHAIAESLLTLGTREAIDILNRDNAATTDDLAGAVGEAVERALDEHGDSGHRWRRRRKRPTHWLCDFLEEIVIALVELDPATAAGNAVKAACRQADPDRTTTTVATAAATKPSEIAVTSLNIASPFSHALLTFRIAAMAACPDPDEHPSLDRTCAHPIAGELTTDGIEWSWTRSDDP